jgi:predicted dehydrogenase
MDRNLALSIGINYHKVRNMSLMADVKNKRFLIVGAGSIGERHARTFRQLGLSIAVVDGRADRASEIAARYGCSSSYTSLQEAPLDQFDAAVIATPADTHIPIASTCMEAGLHLLVEKPLSCALLGAAELISGCQQRKLTLSVAYVLRFHPIVERVRQICQEGTLGHVLSLHAICHHHLPTSRPDYFQTYYASATGGVVLDLSHEVNYIEWLLGPLRLLNCRLATVGELGIPGEAIADISLKSEDSISTQVHLHAADHQNRRECHIVGSRASLTANLLTGEIFVYRTYDPIQHIECKSERDSWHLAQAKDFLQAVLTRTSPRCTGEEGLQTLQLCLQIVSRGSSAE